MALKSDSFEIKTEEEKEVKEAEVKKEKEEKKAELIEAHKEEDECPPEGRYAIASDGHAFWEMPKKKVEEVVDNSVTFELKKTGLDKTVKNIAEEVKEEKPKKKSRKKKVKK